MASVCDLPPRFIRSAHGIYLTVDGNLPLDESKLEGCTFFVNRALMAEDMFYEPAQSAYSNVEEADAVIYRIAHSSDFDELVLIDCRGVPGLLDSTIEDFLNTYQL